MIAKSIVSPSYVTWRKVPPELKEEVWRAIKNVYKVPEFFKDKAIKMANKAWRNGKTPLRRMCDTAGAALAEKNPRGQEIIRRKIGRLLWTWLVMIKIKQPG